LDPEDVDAVSGGLLDNYSANVSPSVLIGVTILPNHPTTAVPALADPVEALQDAPDEIAYPSADTVDFVNHLYIPPPFSPDHFERAILSPTCSV
jgi:hypothetical protein